MDLAATSRAAKQIGGHRHHQARLHLFYFFICNKQHLHLKKQAFVLIYFLEVFCEKKKIYIYIYIYILKSV
jgi:hypothetical protein